MIASSQLEILDIINETLSQIYCLITTSILLFIVAVIILVFNTLWILAFLLPLSAATIFIISSSLSSFCKAPVNLGLFVVCGVIFAWLLYPDIWGTQFPSASLAAHFRWRSFSSLTIWRSCLVAYDTTPWLLHTRAYNPDPEECEL